MRAAAGCALLALSLTACVEANDSTATTRAAIVNGTATTGDEAVVAIIARRRDCDGPPPVVDCTGVLVAPRIVLTAAHCLKLSEVAQYEVVFGAGVGAPGATFVVASGAVRHPAWDPAKDLNDFGYLVLSVDAPVAPLPASALEPKTLAVDDEVRAVGFGRTSAGNDGLKREGKMSVREVTETSFRTAPAPAMTCGGDSGGPVFVERDGAQYLVGLTSRGDAECVAYAINARLDPEFVAGAIATPRGAATIPPDRMCATACTSDDECPHELRCVDARCQLPGSRYGDLGPSCATSAECGGAPCARIAVDACRCARPCAGGPPIAPPTGSTTPTATAAPVGTYRASGGGCSSTRGDPSGFGLLAALLAVHALQRSPRRAIAKGESLP